VTPGDEPVLLAGDLRAGQHLAVLGADGGGKSEVEPAVLGRSHLFCDEWEQASTGGELAAGVAAGAVSRARVTQLGDVMAGKGAGRQSTNEVTLFDSTGLAIQDLGIATAVYDAWREGRIEARSVDL
jgi:ornithine cyclodeaminase/alanine dehydrogenase-like protein (mu-crystallin family)